MMSSTQDKTNLSPNIQNMREHIEFIASGMDDYKDGRIELAYGDEKNIPRLAKTFAVAEIQQMVDFASQQNASGRNVYLVGSFLNPWASPDKRNSDIDFYACNSIWCDIDAPMTSAELKLKYAACPPALVVVTGRKPHLRTHLWWKLIEPINQGAELTAVLDGIIQTIGGDPATKNPVRLMRLAGSIAWPMKKDRVPEQVELNRTAHNKPVSIEQLVRSYPQKRPTATAAKKSGLFLSSFDNPSDTEITEMLAFLDAGCTRKEWLDIGMALHDAGYSFDLWNDWSMKCPAKYDAKAIIRDWNSFKTGGGISLGTLIQRAHDAGYMRASEKPEVHNVKPEVHNVKDGDKSSPPPEPPKPEPKFTGLIAETIADIIATSQLPQPELATLNVLAALGAVFGRRYASPMNTRTNLYTVGIASTGAGKDHSRKYIKHLMIKAGLTTFLGADSLVSGAGMLVAVAKNPAQIMHIDEFGMLLAEIKNKNTASHFKMCARLFLEFYSTSNATYHGAQYADGRPPVRIEKPNVCIYGTSTLSKYIEALDQSVIASGELNRYVIIKPQIEYPKRIKTNGRDTPEAGLIEAWTGLAPMFGANNPLDETPPIIVKWDWQEERVWQIQLFQDNKVQEPLTGALWARYAENVIKIAMIQAIARNPQRPHIETEDFDVAELWVKKSVEFMSTIASEQMYDSQHQKDCNEILDLVKKYGKKMPKRELANRSRGMDQRTRDNALISLEAREAVLIEKEEKNTGRPKYFITAL